MLSRNDVFHARVGLLFTIQSSPINHRGFTFRFQSGQLQHDRSGHDPEELDDAFHRWLTSTELNGDNTNSLDDNLEQETPASTIIDDVGVTNKSDRSNSNSSNSNAPKDNGNGNGIADAVFFRSSYNDYSSEFNGSVVNIDITLTAVDVHPRRQTDLIANGNRTSSKNANSDIADIAGATTIDPQAGSSSSSSSISRAGSGSNQDNTQHSSIVLPYTMTTIITTTPMAPGRMCNVLGKHSSQRMTSGVRCTEKITCIAFSVKSFIHKKPLTWTYKKHYFVVHQIHSVFCFNQDYFTLCLRLVSHFL